jgi:hypothetical protein
MSFNGEEIAYLRSQPLARVARSHLPKAVLQPDEFVRGGRPGHHGK